MLYPFIVLPAFSIMLHFFVLFMQMQYNADPHPFFVYPSMNSQKKNIYLQHSQSVNQNDIGHNIINNL